MRALSETIVAPITGIQSAAVAVIRLSGPDAWRIASQVFSPWPDPVVPRMAVYGRFSHGDDGLAIAFGNGKSYTGEEVVEFSLHGSPASIRGLLDACRAAGARDAGPGEFTQRAFLNGRMDLAQAEAVRDVIEAQTAAQLRHAQEVRSGKLSSLVRDLRERVGRELALIEATVDFSEEIGELDRPACLGRLADVSVALRRLCDSARSGRLLRQGISIALVGRPNAGKSSLLNALLKSDRAIVTAIPGTTRDTIEEAVELGGLLVRLTDTAGVRETIDPIEMLGVERSRQAIDRADFVWHLYDGSVGWTPEDESLVSRDRLRIATKADRGFSGQDLVVSVVNGRGLDALEDWVAKLVPPDQVFVQTWHEPELRSALEGLELAALTLGSEMPVDLATVGLRQALDALGTITGETASDDLLDRIFRDFCIGK